MRLSEYLVLGSSAIRPERGGEGGMNPDSGCALTMAGFAAGVRPQIVGRELDGLPIICSIWEQAFIQWPWLLGGNDPICPKCGCPIDGRNYLFIIMHAFDVHVMADAESERMPLEQLVDYVRSIEPAEEEYLPDEEPWTDSKTTAEMWNSIKGR